MNQKDEKQMQGSDGVETLNKMGYMATSLDAFSAMFVTYAAERK